MNVHFTVCFLAFYFIQLYTCKGGLKLGSCHAWIRSCIKSYTCMYMHAFKCLYFYIPVQNFSHPRSHAFEMPIASMRATVFPGDIISLGYTVATLIGSDLISLGKTVAATQFPGDRFSCDTGSTTV